MTLVTEPSVQYQIWHTTFLCQMRQIDTMSVDYIKIFGVLDTGDPALNNAALQQLEYRRLTIIEMLKYFDQGINVYVKRVEDCKTIYILIQTHLENWAQEAKVALRPDAVPTNELLIMERFANVIYEHAKWYLDKELEGSRFARSFKNDKRSVLNLLKPVSDISQEAQALILEPAARQSLASVFASSAPPTPVKMFSRYDRDE